MKRRYFSKEGYVNIFDFNDRLQELHDRVDGCSTVDGLLKIRRGLYDLKRKYEESGQRYLECEGEILAINEVIAECRADDERQFEVKRNEVENLYERMVVLGKKVGIEVEE